MKKPHRHRKIKTSAPRNFSGCVARQGHENMLAWWKDTVTETCRCGYVRDVNVNNGHFEFGPWRLDLDVIAFTVAELREMGWDGIASRLENDAYKNGDIVFADNGLPCGVATRDHKRGWILMVAGTAPR